VNFTAIACSHAFVAGKTLLTTANSYAIEPTMYGDAPRPTDFLMHCEGDAEPTTMRMQDVRRLVSIVLAAALGWGPDYCWLQGLQC